MYNTITIYMVLTPMSKIGTFLICQMNALALFFFEPHLTYSLQIYSMNFCPIHSERKRLSPSLATETRLSHTIWFYYKIIAAPIYLVLSLGREIIDISNYSHLHYLSVFHIEEWALDSYDKIYTCMQLTYRLPVLTHFVPLPIYTLHLKVNNIRC